MLRRLSVLAAGLALVAGLAAPANAAGRASARGSTAGSAAGSVSSQASPGRQPVTITATGAAGAQLAHDLATVNGPDGVPPPDPSEEYTVSGLRIHLNGYTLGPNAWTDNGMFKIIGWYQDGTKWIRVRSAATCPPCETVGASAMRPVQDRSVGPTVSPTDRSATVRGPADVTPDSLPGWADPAHWHWSYILGKAWSDLWDGCVKGAVGGVIGIAGSTLAANLVARGGAVYLGPWGYAAIAVANCVIGVIDR